MIVIIHTPFPGEIGRYITALTRIAVPIFFMISGFFYRQEKLVGQIKKIALLFVEANVLYLLWDLVYELISNYKLTITYKSIWQFLLLNESPFYGHLWYLGAILYVLIIMWCLECFNCKEIVFILTPVLLIGDLVLGKYSLLVWGKEYSYLLVRNFLFVGIPYFSIGMLMKAKQLRIGSWGIPVFILTTLFERFLLVSFDVNAVRDHYISTTFLSIAAFSFAIEYKGRIGKAVAQIGREYSTWIYIVHPILITCTNRVAYKLGIYNGWCFVAPIVVYISSVVFVAIALGAIKRFRVKQRGSAV